MQQSAAHGRQSAYRTVYGKAGAPCPRCGAPALHPGARAGRRQPHHLLVPRLPALNGCLRLRAEAPSRYSLAYVLCIGGPCLREPRSPSIWGRYARTRGPSSSACPASPSSPSPRSPCGSPQVGRAMLAGGARALGESRLENAQRLRDAGLTAPHLAAARAAAGAGRRDRAAHRRLAAERARDGGRPRERRRGCGAAARRRRHGRPRRPARGHAAGGPAGLPRARQRHGPHRHRRHRRQPHLLRRHRARRGQPRPAGRAGAAERKQLGRPLLVSGGNSGSIGMVISGRMPAAIDTLRIGETILLGVDTLTREPTLDLHLDAITVVGAGHRVPGQAVAAAGHERPGRVRQLPDLHRPRRRAGARSAPSGARTRRPRASRRSTRASRCSAPPATTSSSTSTPWNGRRRSASPSRFVPTYAATLQLFTSPYVHKVFTPPA